MTEKTKEYIVTKPGVYGYVKDDEGKKVAAPIGTPIQLTDAKAKSLVNKVELVVKPIAQAKADDTPPPPLAKKGK